MPVPTTSPPFTPVLPDLLVFGLAVALLAAAGCGEGSGPGVEGPDADGGDTGAQDDPISADLGAEDDTSEDEGPPPTRCGTLFGVPSDKTGLSADQCAPRCECPDAAPFEASLPGEEALADLGSRTLLDPPALLSTDPYLGPEPQAADPDVVCAIQNDPGQLGSYRLVTYPSPEAARDAGATLTHYGPCGLCSSLANLAVYIRNTDLTGPVRSCGLLGIGGGEEANVACLMELGFDEPCAQIWYFNTLHTRQACLNPCVDALDEPYQLADGSLNPCLTCDEEVSGAVFKAVAGRTRRNSGLPSAICRPCESVRHVVHEYPR